MAGLGLYSQGEVFDPGSWHEPGSMLLAATRDALEVIGPGLCHQPGPMIQNEPGCLASPDEPGWMAGIGPELQFERGWMRFGARIKDLFSTSDSTVVASRMLDIYSPVLLFSRKLAK